MPLQQSVLRTKRMHQNVLTILRVGHISLVQSSTHSLDAAPPLLWSASGCDSHDLPVCCRQHTVLVNRGWVPPNWKAEWQQQFMAQQPQGVVSVSGTVQGSESPSDFVPRNEPEAGKYFWMEVPALVSRLVYCCKSRWPQQTTTCKVASVQASVISSSHASWMMLHCMCMLSFYSQSHQGAAESAAKCSLVHSMHPQLPPS